MSVHLRQTIRSGSSVKSAYRRALLRCLRNTLGKISFSSANEYKADRRLHEKKKKKKQKKANTIRTRPIFFLNQAANTTNCKQTQKEATRAWYLSVYNKKCDATPKIIIFFFY